MWLIFWTCDLWCDFFLQEGLAWAWICFIQPAKTGSPFFVHVPIFCRKVLPYSSIPSHYSPLNWPPVGLFPSIVKSSMSVGQSFISSSSIRSSYNHSHCFYVNTFSLQICSKNACCLLCQIMWHLLLVKSGVFMARYLGYLLYPLDTFTLAKVSPGLSPAKNWREGTTHKRKPLDDV